MRTAAPPVILLPNNMTVVKTGAGIRTFNPTPIPAQWIDDPTREHNWEAMQAVAREAWEFAASYPSRGTVIGYVTVLANHRLVFDVAGSSDGTKLLDNPAREAWDHLNDEMSPGFHVEAIHDKALCLRSYHHGWAGDHHQARGSYVGWAPRIEKVC